MEIIVVTIFEDKEINIIKGYKVICGDEEEFCPDLDALIEKLMELKYKLQQNFSQ